MKKNKDQIEAARILLERRRARRSILPFTQYTKPDYQVNWHHKLLCDHLDKFINKEIKRLMVFMPPRHGKSELTSRRLPALLHGMYPNDEIMGISYNDALASDMTIDVQRIMDKPDYQTLFPLSRIVPEGMRTKYARNSNEHELIPYLLDGEPVYPGGAYFGLGVGGSITGRGAKWILIDDPIKNREDADSKNFRENLWKFYSSTVRTRLEGDGGILLTLTRWHTDDLAGRLIQLAKSDPKADQWTVLTIPAEREEIAHPKDPREIGEYLWTQKFPESFYESAKAAGLRDWAALYQQRPTIEGGNLIKSDWIKRYDALPERFDEIIQSWDFATKDKQISDFTVGQVWGRKGSYKYLIHQVRGRWSFPDAVHKLLEVSKMYPTAYRKLIEAKANGPAVIQTLRGKISGLIEIEPRGDKVARLNAVAPEYESGNIWYPTQRSCPWIEEHVTELCDFPNAPNDDVVDAADQAIDYLRKTGPVFAPISGHGSGHLF